MQLTVSAQKALSWLALALFVSFFVSRSLLVVVSLVLLVGGGWAWLAEEKSRAWRYPLVKPCLIWFAAVAVSIVFAAPYEWMGPVAKLRYLLLFFPLTYFFHKEPHFIQRLIPVATAVAVAMGILGALQYFGVPGSQIKGHPLTAVVGDPTHFHARGFMGHHTLFAFPVAMLCQALFAALLWSHDSRQRRLCAVGSAFSALALYTSFSRGSWLAVLAVSLLLIGLRFKRRAALPLLGLIALVGVVLVANPGFRVRFTSLGFSQNGDRVALWRSGLRMFRDSPWMGKGFHSYATYQSHYLTAAEKETYFYVPQEIHNFYLDVACGMGVMGLAALLYFLFCAARNLLAVWPRFSAGSDREQVFYVALSTGIVALLNNVTDSHFYSTYGGPIALYFLAMGQALSIRSPHDA